MSNPLTDSELLFQQIVESRGWKSTQIPQPDVGRSPDFLVSNQSDDRFVAEIKELTANADDTLFFNEMNRYRTASYNWTFGSRIHEKLNSASGQLRKHAAEGLPTIVILYDNISVGGQRVFFPYGSRHLTESDIDAGMFGEIGTPFIKTENTWEVGSAAHTINKSIQSSTNKGHHFSAVAVMIPHTETTSACFRIFHSPLAKVKLSKSVFPDSPDAHFFKHMDENGIYPGWHSAPTPSFLIS
ncbi:MAG TPA: hypothetical protein VNU49_07625 [Opitutaceae bacterium]|jgi:hypothetical protein|nr:hypothetical protein [Opitutaceae bacterium]